MDTKLCKLPDSGHPTPQSTRDLIHGDFKGPPPCPVGVRVAAQADLTQNPYRAQQGTWLKTFTCRHHAQSKQWWLLGDACSSTDWGQYWKKCLALGGGQMGLEPGATVESSIHPESSSSPSWICRKTPVCPGHVPKPPLAHPTIPVYPICLLCPAND